MSQGSGQGRERIGSGSLKKIKRICDHHTNFHYHQGKILEPLWGPVNSTSLVHLISETIEKYNKRIKRWRTKMALILLGKYIWRLEKNGFFYTLLPEEDTKQLTWGKLCLLRGKTELCLWLVKHKGRSKETKYTLHRIFDIFVPLKGN